MNIYLGSDLINAFGAVGKSAVASTNTLNMKIFDWKKRQEFANYQIPDGRIICFINLIIDKILILYLFSLSFKKK